MLKPVSNNPLPSQQNVDIQPPAIITENNQEEWYIEKILDTRTKRKGRGIRKEVLVKWTGYNLPTWELLENVKDTAALEHYKAENGPLKFKNNLSRKNSKNSKKK